MFINDGLTKIEGETHAFLMLGQSNMAGRGELSDVEAIVNRNCYMLRMGRWQKMSEPINPDRGVFSGKFHSGVSLGASFADDVSRTLGWRVGLIPCADGGTKLAEWMPGEILYDHAVMMAGLAARTATIEGILWHQGGSDCATDEDVDAYAENFTKMITALRAALGGDLPLMIGEVPELTDERWGMRERAPRLNAIFKTLAEKLPNAALVPAADLALKPDGLHFNSVSLRLLGSRYASAYMELKK